MNNSDFKKQLINRSFVFARSIIRLTDIFPSKRSSWVITDQLIRAATSIGANIIEAQAASSKRDFTNFLNHALKSGNETKFWLALARDLDHRLEENINTSLREVDELTKILGSSIVKLKGKDKL
ncbi:four helix bundle protein [Candidatus Daviesbacteria bacterium]|nr:four helix bundle protein [Candidatus Daviesbacteria bacterium]